MGLFERSKHLERLAREIADQNLRLLGSKEAAPVDKEETRRQVLELESVLREYRLNLDEAEARRDLALSREKQASESAAQWLERAAFAREKKREDLAEQAGQRAGVYERERDTAHADAENQAVTTARLRSEMDKVERRIAVLRALRKGIVPDPSTTTTHRRATSTTRINFPPRDPLEQAFEDLRDAD